MPPSPTGTQFAPPGTSLAYPPGPDIIPPDASTIPSGKQLGAWTNPFTNAHIINGQPEMMPQGGGFNPMSFLSGGNPYMRAILAAAGIMEPTPTASNDTISPQQAGNAGLLQAAGAMQVPPLPPIASAPQSGGIGSDANRPLMGAGGFPNTYGAPGQQPPVSTGSPLTPLGQGGIGSDARFPTSGAAPPVKTAPRPVNPAAVNLGHSPFVQIDRPNAPAAGRSPGPLQMSALDLSGLFRGGRT